jgi:hypothetical protein
MCALLRIWLLGTYCAIFVGDGALGLKGSHSMGDGQIFLKTRRDASFIKIYRMSLLSAGSISLDRTFNDDAQLCCFQKCTIKKLFGMFLYQLIKSQIFGKLL